MVKERKLEQTRFSYSFKFTHLFYYIQGLVNAFLVLRLLFKLLGANEGAWIVRVIYGVSGALLAPFRGIFRSYFADTEVGKMVFEPSILVAILVYSLVFLGIAKLVEITYDNRKSKHTTEYVKEEASQNNREG